MWGLIFSEDETLLLATDCGFSTGVLFKKCALALHCDEALEETLGDF